MKRKRWVAMTLATLMILSVAIAQPLTARAEGWVDSVAGTLTEGVAVTDTVEESDWVASDRYCYEAWKFSLSEQRVVRFTVESENFHFVDGERFYVYTTADVDNPVYKARSEKYNYIAARNRYTRTTEVTLAKGDYYFVLREYFSDVKGYSYTVTMASELPTVYVSSITLSDTALSLTEGDTKTLTATVAPTNATDKTVTWVSSDATVASVSASGVVSAVSKGTATITASSSDGEIKATCTVTVNEKVIAVDRIELNETSRTLTLDEWEGELVLVPYFYPSNATDQTYTWTCSNSDILRVEYRDGALRGTSLAKGNAVVTVTSSNGLTASCKVTVKMAGRSIKRLKASKNKITTTWNTTSGNVYYQISYSTKKNFKGAKTVTVYNTNKAVLNNLKKGKKYYVRMRTFVNVTKPSYSGWSKAKSITTKK